MMGNPVPADDLPDIVPASDLPENLSSQRPMNAITDYSRQRVAAGDEANQPGALTRLGEGVLAGGSQVMRIS